METIKAIESNTLVLNNHINTIFNEINSSLDTCNKFYFNIAFINYGGLQLFVKTFDDLMKKDVIGKVITSTYLNFTEPKALRKILEFPNVDLKVYGDVKTRGFHSKAYIFEYDDYYKIIIGSANMTSSALKNNIEWNVEIISKKDDPFCIEVIEEFTHLWDSLEIVSEEFLERYDAFINTIKASKIIQRNFIFEYETTIKPNSMQEKAIERLDQIRNFGETKGLVIAATGTGKTYMSAFDVLQVNPKKILFLVHREDILRKSEQSFKRVLGAKIDTGFLTGKEKNIEVKYLFSTMQTMNNTYQMFEKDEFDYIIIDEAHHVTSPTYQTMMKYFMPKFLLGMTATPERSDGADIFEQFDNNVALEVRLQEALEERLIVPFHYFGITDISGVDLSDLRVDDISEMSKRLKVHERVDFIIEQMKLYGHDGDKLKCLGFCVSKDHANYMCDEFNVRNIPSIWLSGDVSAEVRSACTKRLEDEKDPLQVIFTIDIFNEGIDIPSVNMVLMLRPTNSPIVFIQQLGRGLRKHEDKEYLTVLDFIGNHNRAYLIAIALKGSRYYDKDSLKVSVHNNFSDLPGEVHVQMDEIAKDRILKQIDDENFNAIKYLKEEYLSFKILNKGRVPFSLMTYLKYEGAPNPLRFIHDSKTYLQFLEKVETNTDFNDFILDKDYMKALKYVSDMLPLRRPHEFALLHTLLEHDTATLDMRMMAVGKYIKNVSELSVVHASRNLNFEFSDKGQLARAVKLVELTDQELVATKLLNRIKENKDLRFYLEDVINFGLICYEKEFGDINYGNPFFKLYACYSMQDTALLSDYTKTISSFRGSGLLTNGNDYFLYVDLKKDEDIKESINYKDKFIDRKTFQWESPNSTAQNTDRGQNLIHNEERGIRLHLFVRKFKVLDRVSQPYIYVGKANAMSFKDNKPIMIIMRLEKELPVELYAELTTIVE